MKTALLKPLDAGVTTSLVMRNGNTSDDGSSDRDSWKKENSCPVRIGDICPTPKKHPYKRR